MTLGHFGRSSSGSWWEDPTVVGTEVDAIFIFYFWLKVLVMYKWGIYRSAEDIFLAYRSLTSAVGLRCESTWRKHRDISIFAFKAAVIWSRLSDSWTLTIIIKRNQTGVKQGPHNQDMSPSRQSQCVCSPQGDTCFLTQVRYKTNVFLSCTLTNRNEWALFVTARKRGQQRQSWCYATERTGGETATS